MNNSIKLFLPLVSLMCSSAVQAGVYFDAGVGGVFSSTNSSYVENSTAVLFTPTAIGTSLFSLPNVNWQNHFKNGFDLSAAAGYRFNDQWRVDEEFLYQNIQRNSFGSYGWLEQNSLTGAVYAQQFNNPISNVSTRAHLYSLMTNAAHDFGAHSGWTPFIGGGIGVSWLRSKSVVTHDIINIDDPNTPLVEKATANQISPSLYGTAFAWQFKAGVSHALSDRASVMLQYRLLGTTDFKASNSLIVTNPGVAGQSNFYVAPSDIDGLLTQAIELNLRLDV